MNALIYLVPLTLLLGLTGLAGFPWTIRSGQYEDLDGVALRILPADDVAQTQQVGQNGGRKPLL